METHPRDQDHFPIRPTAGKGGFALVVTVSLMVLLTLIAVGMLTISSISLRSSASASAMAEARANARLALMLAIGELQKHAGPDQRVTCSADIAGTATGDPVENGAAPANDATVTDKKKDLSAVQAGTRHWTGVFANQDAANLAFRQTPSPKLVQWLVSGAESNYPTSPPSVLPNDPRCAVGASGKVSDDSKAVVLVGENSVGTGTPGINRHVAVPKVNLTDKSGTKPAGRFGWWVGDEGTKASLHIPETVVDPSNPASLVAQRRGWETIEGLSQFPVPGTEANASLARLTSNRQAELLIASFSTPAGDSTPLQATFHSATAASRGLLTDTQNGGTRVDLSTLLAGTLPNSNPVPSIANYPSRNTNIVPRSVAATMRAPRWDAVKEFHDRATSLKGGELIAKPAANDLAVGISPLVTDFRILMGARIRVKDAAATNFTINSCGKIAVAIANPYSRPLKWERDLEFEVMNMTPAGNKPSRIWNIGDRSAFIPQNTGEAAVFNNAIFRIRSSSLQPGEARAYTMSSYVLRPAANGTQRIVIDLAPFATSAPFNFGNCIELENTTPVNFNENGNTPGLDVRESWQTTLVALEMRLNGSSGVLRRIERFELDNGYFSPNTRSFSKAEAMRVTQPFPLMLYSFQLSQPGADYKALMPSTYDIGMRASTIRTFADFNLQATRFRKPIASYNPPPFFVESNDSRAQLPANPPGGETGTGFTRNLVADPLPWGRSASGSRATVLFSVPTRISSLAMLQHADLTGDDRQASIAHQPGNAVGNSWATPFVKRRLTSQPRTDYELIGVTNRSGTNQTATTYYDLSHLLNTSLWDTYYFSMIPTSGPAVPENPTLVVLGDSSASDLKDPVNAATRLVTNGAFNINSTDKNAWKAFLASARHSRHNADGSANADAAFPRSLDQPSPSATPPSGSNADSFAGFRRLNDQQLDLLATEIVRQVRLRGPFVSLSHFVNRAIAPVDKQPALTRSGALQSAIDEAGLNINHAGNRNVFSAINPTIDQVTMRAIDGAPRADFDGSDPADRPASAGSDPDWATRSTDNNFGSVASIIADRETLLQDSLRREQGYRSTGIPGWLTQADVLQVIGPAISARSDTFLVRCHGEALDANGKVTATAYCEAVIQRMHGYVDPSNPPRARGNELTPINRTFGRKYEIVSFRWLTPSEI